MSDSTSNAVPEFIFTSDAADSGAEDYFTVVSFEATEGISRLYEYRIELKASDTHAPDVDFLDDMLRGNPCFTIKYTGAEDCPVYGMLASFDENNTAAGYTYYTATLVPRLWQLTLNKTSKVFNDPSVLTVKEVLESMLDDEYQDVAYRTADIQGPLQSKNYRCQFNETDFDFISRLLENEGIYYYFDQQSGTDTLVFSDGPAGDDTWHTSEIEFDVSPSANKLYQSITGWSCRKTRLPGSVALESYNPSAPADDVFADHDIEASFSGNHYVYGGDFNDDDGGYNIENIAQIRAEEFAVKNTRYYGQSGVCGLRSGYVFAMNNHPNDAFNNSTNYLITEVTHRGFFLDSTASSGSHESSRHSHGSGKGHDSHGKGLGLGHRDHDSHDYGSSTSSPLYENNFVAIDETVQYRPARVTHKPRFHGIISAFIYAAAPGEYAELDEHGRFRVLLPFKRSTIIDDSDRASHYIRMSQPYAGGVINSEGQWEEEGLFYPLMDGTEVFLTFVNGDPDRPVISGAVSNQPTQSLVNSENSNQSVFSTHGMSVTEVRGGAKKKIKTKDWTFVDPEFSFGLYEQTTESPGGTRFSTEGLPLDMNDGRHHIKMMYGDQYNYTEGNIYNWGADFTIGFGNDYEEIHESEEQIEGEHFNMTEAMRSLGTTLKEHDYVADAEISKDYSEWEDGQDGLVEKSWGDKCEYHFGRAFNWSGGVGPGGSLQTYNYGNGYTENLLEVSGGTAETNDLDTSHDSYAAATYKTNTIDPSISSIEKKWGNSYSYTNGYTAEITVGDTLSETYGDKKETIHGDADNKVMGRTSDMFLGAKNEMNVNAANSMTVGLTNDLFIGGKIDTTLAVVMEVSAGVKIEANGAAEMELKMVSGKLKLCEMDTTTAASLSTVTTALKANVTAIKATATAIESGATEIKNKAIAMKNAAFQMLG